MGSIGVKRNLRLLLLCGLVVLASLPVLAGSRCSFTWFGNSFDGKRLWVQNLIESMWVTADGTVYTNSGWDEAGQECGIYKDGQIVGRLSATHMVADGGAITADETAVWFSRAKAEDDQGYVTCYFRDERGKYKFRGTVKVSEERVAGLAVGGGLLFASDAAGGKIKVFDPVTLEFIREWPVERPGKLVVDGSGNVWVIQQAGASGGARILCFSKEGQLRPQRIQCAAGEIPIALAYDRKANRLLVADNGPDQNIKIYVDLDKSPKLAGTFGVTGGIYGGTPGLVGPGRFHDLSGVGIDDEGNIYVACGFSRLLPGGGWVRSGTELESYRPDGTRNWVLYGLEFVDMAEADPASDGCDLYTKHEHIVMDYDKPAGKDWTYKGYTLNPIKYPQDPRLYDYAAISAPFIRRIQGRLLMFLTDMYSDSLRVYRFNPATDGEVAIPCGYFAKNSRSSAAKWLKNAPAMGEWIWIDKDGDGQIEDEEFLQAKNPRNNDNWGFWVDDNGDVWMGGNMGGQKIRRYIFQGFNEHGVPMWDPRQVETFEMPMPFVDLQRVMYYPQTDTMYLAGYTVKYPNDCGAWKVVGRTLIRYDGWRSGSRKPRYQIVFPGWEMQNQTASIAIAGDYIFSIFVKKPEVIVWDAETGQQVETITLGREIYGEVGWVDIPHGLSAFKRKNGEYIICIEEDFRGKVLVLRWHPGDSALKSKGQPAPVEELLPPPQAKRTPIVWSGESNVPAPWKHGDIGDISEAGGAIFDGDKVRIIASGSDIWGTFDGFHYVYQIMEGDGEILVRVASLGDSDGWTKAGVMIRADLSPQSPHAMTVVTHANGVAFQYRPSPGAESVHVPGPAVTAPYWVKIVRAGDRFTGYHSADGKQWEPVGSTTIPMPRRVYVGLVLTAHSYEYLNEAVFDGLVLKTAGAGD